MNIIESFRNFLFPAGYQIPDYSVESTTQPDFQTNRVFLEHNIATFEPGDAVLYLHHL